MVWPRDLKFLADQNIAPAVVEFLRAAGLDVVGVRDRGLRGRPDSVLLTAATDEERVVLSHDTDFGTLAVLAGARCHGIVVVRPGDLLAAEVIRLLEDFLDTQADLVGPFVVVLEPGRIRVRSLPR